jgi:hypothetical protein
VVVASGHSADAQRRPSAFEADPPFAESTVKVRFEPELTFDDRGRPAAVSRGRVKTHRPRECGKNELIDRSVLDDRRRLKDEVTPKITVPPSFHTSQSF